MWWYELCYVVVSGVWVVVGWCYVVVEWCYVVVEWCMGGGKWCMGKVPLHCQIRASGVLGLGCVYSRLSHFSAIWRLADWAIGLCSVPLSREGLC
jgi:hypothetical protein